MPIWHHTGDRIDIVVGLPYTSLLSSCAAADDVATACSKACLQTSCTVWTW